MAADSRARSRPCRHGPHLDGSVDDRSDGRCAGLCHQRPEHRGVAGLARGQQHDQRHPVPVDEHWSDLRRQPAAGTADRVVRRLSRMDRAVSCNSTQPPVRRVTLVGVLVGSSDRGVHRQRPVDLARGVGALRSNRRQHRVPRRRRSPSADARSTPSATLRTPSADHATRSRSDSGRRSPRPSSEHPRTAGPCDPSDAATHPRSTTTGHQTTPRSATCQHAPSDAQLLCQTRPRPPTSGVSGATSEFQVGAHLVHPVSRERPSHPLAGSVPWEDREQSAATSGLRRTRCGRSCSPGHAGGVVPPPGSRAGRRSGTG